MKILVSLIAFAISCFFSSSEYSDLTFLDKRIYHMGKIASYDTTFLKTIRFTNECTYVGNRIIALCIMIPT